MMRKSLEAVRVIKVSNDNGTGTKKKKKRRVQTATKRPTTGGAQLISRDKVLCSFVEMPPSKKPKKVVKTVKKVGKLLMQSEQKKLQNNSTIIKSNIKKAPLRNKGAKSINRTVI